MPLMESSRPLEIADFLDQQGWGDASAEAFDGDFSPRRYTRLTKAGGQTALLMDADENQKTSQFVGIAKILRTKGITAPDIYAALPDRGLVLLEDFGKRNVGLLWDTGEPPRPYILRATDILATLHHGFERRETLDLDLPLFTADVWATQAELFLDAYFSYTQQRDATPDERSDFHAAWMAVLRPLDTMPKSLLLRDFMPDNLMDLPDHTIGVLDFQDAGIGCIAYDLASLCEEVRRDGGFSLLPDVLARYREQTPSALSPGDLHRACIIFSAQRHVRILGIIVQLALKTGRRDKLAFLPRIRQHLSHILHEPYLGPVHEWMQNFEKILS